MSSDRPTEQADFAVLLDRVPGGCLHQHVLLLRGYYVPLQVLDMVQGDSKNVLHLVECHLVDSAISEFHFVQDLSGGDHLEAIGRGPDRTLESGAQALDESCFKKRRLSIVPRLMPVVCILRTRNLGVSHAHRDGNVGWCYGPWGDDDRSPR